MQFDLAQNPCRYDGWTIFLTRLHGVAVEIFDKPTRTVLIDPTAHGPKVAIAHATAHIALRHHLDCADGVFTEIQELKADTHARDLLAAAVEWAATYEPVVSD